jgi:histidine phosphotransferase ChpT
MKGMIERRVAELMFAHLCHELIGPVTAINNGFELVDPGRPVPDDVLELLLRSAKTGSQRLRFYRIAYGALADDSAFGLEDARGLIDEFLDSSKVRMRWSAAPARLGPIAGRLLLNVAALGAEALPRGGTMEVLFEDGGFTLVCTGTGARVSDECLHALSPDIDVATLTPRAVHAYFASRLAQAHGGALRIHAAAPNRVDVVAEIAEGL